MGSPVNMVTPEGDTIAVDEGDVQGALARGFHVEGADESAHRVTGEVKAERYAGPVGSVVATGLGALRSATGGLSDVGFSALGEGDEVANLKDAHPYASLGGEIAGMGAGFGGLASKAGQGIAKTAEGASLATKLTRTAAGYGVEGGLQGLGQGASELALSDDPLTAERIASVLTSNTLLGGGIGAGAGTIGKLAETGILRAKGALDEIAAGSRIGSDVTGDLAGMDAKALRGAHEAELGAIEAQRVPQRAQLADEIKSFRQELKEQKIYLATKGAEERELREIGKRSLDADRQLDRLLNNPKRMAEKPELAKAALQQQEAALEDLAKNSDALKAKFASDTSGERMAALENSGKALERNRELQARIADMVAPAKSERLAAIEDARTALSAPKPAEGIGQKMAGGAAYSMASGMAASIPFVGPLVAPFVGQAAAAAVGARLGGKLAKGVAESAERTSAALGKFLDVAAPVARAAPVLATKVLGAVRYGEPQPESVRGVPAPKGRSDLATAYHARADELRSQTQYAPDGNVTMRPAARLKMADRLDPVRQINHLLADRLETLAARKVEFLAAKLPRRPDLTPIQTGPDHWQPSDMEMRTFARYAAAAEDPDSIVDRLAAGSITPEDAEVMREVYPEKYAQITAHIAANLPELRASLPYQRRLALSIFSGVPVDPAMHPEVLSVLQAQFDPGPDESKAEAPMPKPQFGSVKSESATPAQARADGGAA